MEPDHAIADRAAEWLARRDRGLAPGEARELAAWLAADPRHGAELARLGEFWALSDRAGRNPELVRMAAAVQARREPNARRTPFRWAGAALAGAAAACAIWVVARRPGQRAEVQAGDYRVMPAAARTLRLADGSVVELRDGGELKTDFSWAVRRVVLESGEADFAVAKNPARPFIVSLGAVAVRAVGTAFDISVRPSEIDVLVTEGKVTVEDTRGSYYPPAVPLLVAGQRARIALGDSGRVDRVAVDVPAAAEVDRELAWRSTWLVFDRTPLGSAVDAFNRNGRQRLVLGDPALRDRRLGGSFRVDDVDAFVRLLQDSLDVTSERRSDGAIVLLPQR